MKPKLKPKKICYLKNYDPKVAPDPERWFPLRERSYYKKGKKRDLFRLAVVLKALLLLLVN